jgi:5-methylcytosine-specific restriction endonuclease McrA
MSSDCQEVEEAPAFIPCDLRSRTFPPAWKGVWFRRRSHVGDEGLPIYKCPLCRRDFDHSMLDYLQGDHVWPHSLFGETSWNNYQLICGNCNAAKSNSLDGEVRTLLGAGEFRRQVALFLKKHVELGNLASDAVMANMLSATT